MWTKSSLKEAFFDLGVKPGMTVLVHSSLKAVGYVAGGPVGVIFALEELLTEEGTLVMPTFNTDLTDPAQWQAPPIKKSQLREVLDEMPAFDPELTPTKKMGCVSETFRKQPGVVRSAHPHLSFAGWGKNANKICTNHSFARGLWRHSPLQKIYDLGGHVLLLGVDHDRNTSMHLAEYDGRVGRDRIEQKAPVMEGGKKVWVEFEEIDLDNSDFVEIGRSFESEINGVTSAKVGDAVSKFMSQKQIVVFAKGYINKSVQ